MLTCLSRCSSTRRHGNRIKEIAHNGMSASQRHDNADGELQANAARACDLTLVAR